MLKAQEEGIINNLIDRLDIIDFIVMEFTFQKTYSTRIPLTHYLRFRKD